MHRLGLGGAVDFPKAFDFFGSVTKQSTFPELKPKAQLHLAKMYRFGEGRIPVNIEKARDLYRAATEQQFDERVREEASRLLMELEPSSRDAPRGKKRLHDQEEDEPDSVEIRL